MLEHRLKTLSRCFKSKNLSSIYVVDPNLQSIKNINKAIPSNSQSVKINICSDVLELPKRIDLAIISTQSEIRKNNRRNIKNHQSKEHNF